VTLEQDKASLTALSQIERSRAPHSGKAAKPAMQSGRLGETTVLPLVAILTLLLDQITKHLVRANLPEGASWYPVPALGRWFSITHSTNTGAAFGLFPGLGVVLVVIAISVIIFILVFWHRLPAGDWLLRLCLGLMLGGAVGNLVDRLVQGRVTDFVRVGLGPGLYWPSFNVADSAIVIGVAILVWHTWAESNS